MKSISYRAARRNLAGVLNSVEAGEVVEIVRRGREPAILVSRKVFDAYKKVAQDTEFSALFDAADSTNKELARR